MNKKTIIQTVTVVAPLIAGVALYIWLRPDAFVTKSLAGICPWMKEVAYCGNNHIIRLFRNHLSDFLWAYSFMMCIYWIGESHGIDIRKRFVICLTVCILFEVSQIINPYFTFDIIDILTELIGITAAGFTRDILNRHLGRRQKNESK